MPTLVNDRIDVRISKEQKELIKYASALSGFKNLTEFIVHCINTEAQKIIKENDTFLNTLEDKKIFLNAILNPPPANDKLKKAHLSHTKFIASNELKD